MTRKWESDAVWGCQAGICCSQLNSFIYLPLFLNMSVSTSSYLALTTRKPQHTGLHVFLTGRHNGNSASSPVQRNSQEKAAVYVLGTRGEDVASSVTNCVWNPENSARHSLPLGRIILNVL